MAYGNYSRGYGRGGGRSYGGGRSSYGRSSYGGRSYSRSSGRPYGGFSGGYGGYKKSYKRRSYSKKSGATSGVYGADQVAYVRGWKKEGRDIMTVLCVPTSGTKRVESKNGKLWENWMVVYRIGRGAKNTTSGMYECQTGRVIVDELSLVLNPKAPNGGYCGSNFQRKKRYR